MQRVLVSVFLLTVFLVAGFAAVVPAQEGLALEGLSTGSSAEYYHTLIGAITGKWQGYGKLFTTLQGQYFGKIFLAIIVAVPAVFLLHYLLVGPMHFDHDGEKVFFFPLFIRIVHLFAAASISLLVITGLMVVLGSYLGGGVLVRTARTVHIVSAMAFVLPGILMFIFWVKDMLPQPHDFAWLFILGGYLSKEKKAVPAGKFNAGQKMYFWLVTVGGGVMAYTGYLIWGMGAALDAVRLSTIIHNVLGMAIVAFVITHVYMSVFAISGALNSMLTGYKPKEEVDILHSRYTYQRSEKVLS